MHKMIAQRIKLKVDWEERLSLLLQEAIEFPDNEPEVCERLINFVLFLLENERETYRRKFRDMLQSALDSGE
jgi:hypothetical protein